MRELNANELEQVSGGDKPAPELPNGKPAPENASTKGAIDVVNDGGNEPGGLNKDDVRP